MGARYALRTIFKNYHLHQGSSCHLTISIASSGLHDLCKVIRVFIKGSKTSWASPLSTKASGSSLGSSASSAGLLQELQQSGDIDDIKTMLASMTISSTTYSIVYRKAPCVRLCIRQNYYRFELPHTLCISRDPTRIPYPFELSFWLVL